MQNQAITPEQVRRHLAIDPFFDEGPCWLGSGTNAHITAFYQLHPDEIPKYTAEHYDYEKQVWIGADGRYLSCNHPPSMNCKCFGKLHYGEVAL